MDVHEVFDLMAQLTLALSAFEKIVKDIDIPQELRKEALLFCCKVNRANAEFLTQAEALYD